MFILNAGLISLTNTYSKRLEITAYTFAYHLARVILYRSGVLLKTVRRQVSHRSPSGSGQFSHLAFYFKAFELPRRALDSPIYVFQPFSSYTARCRLDNWAVSILVSSPTFWPALQRSVD